VDTSAHLNLSSVRLNWLRGRLLTIASYRFVIRAAVRDSQRVCISLVHSNWRCECALIGCQLLNAWPAHLAAHDKHHLHTPNLLRNLLGTALLHHCGFPAFSI
jgi:hypothetical protein